MSWLGESFFIFFLYFFFRFYVHYTRTTFPMPHTWHMAGRELHTLVKKSSSSFTSSSSSPFQPRGNRPATQVVILALRRCLRTHSVGLPDAVRDLFSFSPYLAGHSPTRRPIQNSFPKIPFSHQYHGRRTPFPEPVPYWNGSSLVATTPSWEDDPCDRIQNIWGVTPFSKTLSLNISPIPPC